MSANNLDTYREEIWEAVSHSWTEQAARRRRMRTATRFGGAALGLAAMLVAGIFVGRWTTIAPDDAPGRAIVMERIAIEPALPISYRVAFDEHLQEAETLLLLFNTSRQTDAELGLFARELAATSRMLMSSRVGEDAELRSLLLDLELLLVQIARIVDDGDTGETEIVRDSVRQTAVLARMRSMMSEQPASTGI